jgi:hypothetical protein
MLKGSIRVHNQNNTVAISREHLGNEPGTTRVVIPRILKQFEQVKKGQLFRGYIQLSESKDFRLIVLIADRDHSLAVFIHRSQKVKYKP